MDRAPSPYDFLPPVPSFQASSHDIAEGEMLAMPHVSGIFGAGGEDVSPHLSWSGPPDDTQSYAVTCFDPDAPTGQWFLALGGVQHSSYRHGTGQRLRHPGRQWTA